MHLKAMNHSQFLAGRSSGGGYATHMNTLSGKYWPQVMHVGFGENIRYYRIRRGLQRRELARLMNTSKPTISRWETGKHEPNMDVKAKLAQVLGVTVDGLMGEKPIPLPALDSWKKAKNLGEAAMVIEDIAEAHGLTDEEAEGMHLEAAKHFRFLVGHRGNRGCR